MRKIEQEHINRGGFYIGISSRLINMEILITIVLLLGFLKDLFFVTFSNSLLTPNTDEATSVSRLTLKLLCIYILCYTVRAECSKLWAYYATFTKTQCIVCKRIVN